ncbi:MAG: 50S ribosomal protein L23 [Hyphomicrobiaceae bacterium]
MKMNAYDVIKSPVITEKATMASEANQVIFKVANKASKTEIKTAVEKLFNVKVKAVNTLVRKGKKKAFRGIQSIQRDTKRAIVTLEEGHSIDVTTGL